MYRYKATLISISLAIFLLLAVLALSKTATAKLDPDSQKFDQSGQVFGNESSFLTGPNQGQPLDIALDYIDANKDQFDLTASDLSDVAVTDQYTSKQTGVTHIYLRQRYEGIEIINANININIARDGSVINMGNSFVADLESSVNSTTPEVQPLNAVELAAESVGLSLSSPLVPEKQSAGDEQGLLFSGGGVSQEPIPVTLVYESQEEGVYLAWNVEIYEKSGDHWWSTRVDAIDGSILSQYDRVLQDLWGAAQKGDSEETTFQSELDINPFEINSIGNLTGTYLVYALPDESPIHSSGRSLVVNPANQIASPYGWHDVDGVEGPEFTRARGNNVYAYTDLNDNDSPDPGSSPDGGSSLVFSYTLDLADDPSLYRRAAVTNLFYWNNIMHDVSYLYGFDEAAGNFQENNYGRGGVGSDSLNAEAQDGASVGKKNNANFATPPDGGNPQMQMFIWDAPSPDRDGDLDNGIIAHEYGHGISLRLVGGPNNVNCLNNDEQMGEGWSDWQSMIMTMKQGDNGQDGRGVGTYVLDQNPDGNGIRPAPYSTAFAVNGYTYEDIASVSGSPAHGIGFIWNTMLWEMLWALIDVHGFNPDIYGSWESGGNNLANQLVIDGMKLSPCSPGFVDARDAILQADQVLTGGVNQCTIWASFAKRGLGFSASQGDSDDRGDGVESFDEPSTCSPEIDVMPESLENELYADIVDTSNLSIKNVGGENLDWLLQELNSFGSLSVNGFSQNLEGYPTNIAFAVDDATSEGSVGGDNIGQFIWFNRFTPNKADFPLTLEEIWVQFSDIATQDGDIDLYIYEDTDNDADPGTGASLLARVNEKVQFANDHPWSKYELSPTITIQGDGDILVGVVNRYNAAFGADFPARIDQTDSQQRSWVGAYDSGLVPEEPTFPADDWGTIDNFGIPGNWMIRAYGYKTCASLVDISWLSASPISGILGADGEQLVEISFDSTGLDLGDYNANLCIANNDLNKPLITVPVTLTVSGLPVANDDNYTVTMNSVLMVGPQGVLENDSGIFNKLFASIEKTPLNGTISLEIDGSFVYTPTAGFVGDDSFEYRAIYGSAESNIAEVKIMVIKAEPDQMYVYIPILSADLPN